MFPGESADLAVMLADSPHSITVAGVSRPCFYDVLGEVAAEGNRAPQVVSLETASVLAADFPALNEGATATITEAFEGQTLWHQDYTLLRIVPRGAFSECLLQRVQ